MSLFSFFDPMQRYIEALLAGRRPKRFRVGNQEDLDALKMAALLLGEADPKASEPDPAFAARLEQQLRAANGTAATTSRRGFLTTGLAGAAGLAAGLLAGIGLDRFSSPAAPAATTGGSGGSGGPLIRDNGHWFNVARLSELPANATRRFTAGALEGHLVRRGDQIHAVSAICSHQPCSLVYQEKQDNFLCPCHNATFLVSGEPRQTDRSYGPLTRINVAVQDDQVMVWSIDLQTLPPPPSS